LLGLPRLIASGDYLTVTLAVLSNKKGQFALVPYTEHAHAGMLGSPPQLYGAGEAYQNSHAGVCFA